MADFKYCEYCGAQINKMAEICPKCGCRVNNITEKDKKDVTIVLGYVFTILIPIIGLIFAIYNLIYDNVENKKHGKYQLILFAVMFVINIIVMFVIAQGAFYSFSAFA